MRKTSVIVMVVIISCSSAMKFKRKILAVGLSYYKILMTLGTCKENLLFKENKIWARLTINRILDIYYKSSNDEYKVSKVEILVVINHSDVLASSVIGVGKSEFSASLYLPSDTVVTFYSLKIYTCSQPVIETSVNVEDSSSLVFFNGSVNKII